ncbi:MAG TPA: ATP-binding protein [Desulfuromonadaceae bacterium]
MSWHARLQAFRSSFRFELFAIFTIITAVITLLFSLLYIYYEIEDKKEVFAEKAQLLATHLAENVRLPLYAENREVLLYLANEAAANPVIHAVTISTADGRVLTQVQSPTLLKPSQKLTKIIEVHSSALGTSAEAALGGGNTSNKTLLGRVKLVIDMSSMAQVIRNIILNSFLLGWLFWFLVSLGCHLALRKVTRSFSSLMHGIQSVRGGNFKTRIKIEREDETGQAAAAINELAVSLQLRDELNQRLQEKLVKALRLEVQTEKKQLMAKLIQTNRMTSLGLLASSMAHEINNPNASIRLAGQYLSRAYQDALPLLRQISAEEGDFSLGGLPFSSAEKHILECFTTIDRSSDRISHVIQDLRSYSLGERNEFSSEVNILQVIDNAITIVRSHGKHTGTNIFADAEQNIPVITGNRHQLEQVLVNLLMNALQATPDNKGAITVFTSCNKAADEVYISIRDEGEGIPQENLKHLFEPFFSTRIDKGGSGLGLFVTNFIVTAHQGRLTFSSLPDAGTIVTIYLPVRQTASQS